MLPAKEFRAVGAGDDTLFGAGATPLSEETELPFIRTLSRSQFHIDRALDNLPDFSELERVEVTVEEDFAKDEVEEVWLVEKVLTAEGVEGTLLVEAELDGDGPGRFCFPEENEDEELRPVDNELDLDEDEDVCTADDELDFVRNEEWLMKGELRFVECKDEEGRSLEVKLDLVDIDEEYSVEVELNLAEDEEGLSRRLN